MNNMWKSILNESKKDAWGRKLVKSVQKDVVRELQQSYTSGPNKKRFINWLASQEDISGRAKATKIYEEAVLPLILTGLKTPVKLVSAEEIGSKDWAAYYLREKIIKVSDSWMKNIEAFDLKDSGYARKRLTWFLKHEFFHAIDHLIGNQLYQTNPNWKLFSGTQKKTIKGISADMSTVEKETPSLKYFLSKNEEEYSQYKTLQNAIDKLGKPITPELIKRLCKRKWSFKKRQTAVVSYITAKRAGDAKGMKKYAFWNRPEDAVLALPVLHMIDCTESGYKETALKLQRLAGVVPGQLSKNIAEEVKPTKELKALVFGHSQTQGMGIALRSALKRKGIKNIVYAPYPGFNDQKLAGKIKKVAKDPSSFTHVFLYLGGNLGQKNPNIMTGHMADIINHFTSNGVDKDSIFVTLPPVNVPKMQRAAKMRPSKREVAYWKKKTKKDRSPSWIKWRMSKWMKAQDFFESFLKTQLSSSNVVRVKGKVGGDGIHAKRSDAVTTQHINLILSNLRVQPGGMQRGIAVDNVDNPEVPITRRIAESEEGAKTKVLICGHSQTYGLGGRLQSKLKAKGGVSVKKFKNGANDALIASLISNWAPDPTEFTHVVVYCGGNSGAGPTSRANSLIKVVNHFKTADGGPTIDNIFLVLPPTNGPTIKRRIKNEANEEDLKYYRKKKEDSDEFKKKWVEGLSDDQLRVEIQRRTARAWKRQLELLKKLRGFMPKENVIKIVSKKGWPVSRGPYPPAGDQSSKEHIEIILKKIGDPKVQTGADVKALKKGLETEKEKRKASGEYKPLIDLPKTSGRTFRTSADIGDKMSDQIRAHFGLARKSIGAGSMKQWDRAGSLADQEAEKKRREKQQKDTEAATKKREEEEAREKAKEKNKQ